MTPLKTDAVTLELTAREQTRVVFRAEGQPTETLAMNAGNSVTLHAQKEATLLATNPAVLQAKLNGKAISFGEERRPRQFVITPRGVDESPFRRKESAQSPESARLLIKSPAIAEFLTVIVRMDDEFLFRRDATASPPAGPDQGRRRLQMGAIATVPLAEERLIPPGEHKFQVNVLLGGRRVDQVEEVTAQFNPGQRRTLHIRFVRGANRFTVTLE